MNDKIGVDRWAEKGGRYRLIIGALFLSCTAFAAYDGKHLYGSYLNRCYENPESAECRPLNLPPKLRRVDSSIKQDYGRGKWAIEVGSNLEESEANSRSSALQASGIPTRVHKISKRRGLYQVQLGRFLTQKNATEVGNQLQTQGFISQFTVVTYR